MANNNSAFMKSLSAQFNPKNKAESKSKMGRQSSMRVSSGTTPTRKKQSISFGK